MKAPTETKTCMGCGAAPAQPGNKTLPLCASCAAQAQQAKRGVEFQKT